MSRPATAPFSRLAQPRILHAANLAHHLVARVLAFENRLRSLAQNSFLNLIHHRPRKHRAKNHKPFRDGGSPPERTALKQPFAFPRKLRAQIRVLLFKSLAHRIFKNLVEFGDERVIINGIILPLILTLPAQRLL